MITPLPRLGTPVSDRQALMDLLEQCGLDRSVIAQLGTCQFITRHQNVVFQGFTGSGKSYLGCALAKQACLHRIPGLLDRFLYLNDDFFFGRPVRPELFFHGNGIAKFSLSPIAIDRETEPGPMNGAMLAARKGREFLEQTLGRTVTHRMQHVPHAHHRSTLAEFEARHPDLFHQVAHSRFRNTADLSIASDRAIFGQVGPRMGSVDPGFGTAYLARVVGEKKAREIWFLCRQYGAQEALAMGLVNKVVPAAELQAEVERWCAELNGMSPTAIKIAKQSFNADTDQLHGTTELGFTALEMYYGSPEGEEGRKAFEEKRKPEFAKYRR